MKSSNFIKEFAKEAKINENESKIFVNSTVEVISGLLKQDKTIILKNFGSLKSIVKTTRINRNPKSNLYCFQGKRRIVKFSYSEETKNNKKN